MKTLAYLWDINEPATGVVTEQPVFLPTLKAE